MNWAFGRWRAKVFIDHDGFKKISPDSTPEARRKRSDRYDRCHYSAAPWWDDSPHPAEHEVKPRPIRVDQKGRVKKR